MTHLSVNLNKIALLRNSRTLGIPSVTRAASIALEAGARGITVHPRPDGRHIRTHDVHDLIEVLKRYPDAEFNIEGNPYHSVLDLVMSVRPHQFTLVPDDPSAFTSDHGWDLERDGARLAPIIAQLKHIGVRVSLFMDPEPAAMGRAAALGADRVELYTEPYAASYGGDNEAATLERYTAAADAARRAGLAINAGHDLNQQNLGKLVAAIPDIAEVSIGHALTAEALEDGLAITVKNYVRILEEASRSGKRTT
ncbi:MAG: pyridoxine 5'-phosphate synthase [Rhodospirillaceae bacterium]